jgi:hypothetical protein
MFTKGVGDIQIIAVQLMLDGSERLSWSSKACDCSGILAYKAGLPTPGTVVRAKYLWLFNTFSINAYQGPYADIFSYAFELLTFPPDVSLIEP